mgnify:CR=1 FL=1
MYNLNEITFLTFVRLDNEERIENLKAMYSYYKKTCINYSHIIIEDDTTSKVPSVLDLDEDDVYVYMKSSTEWRKCVGFNAGIKLAKTNILKVPKKIIQKHGAVSVQCCLSMVNNLSKISKSKLCISVTGIAGPKGGSKQKPVGLTYIGIKIDKIVKINKYIFKNRGRNYIQKATVNKALKLTHNLL